MSSVSDEPGSRAVSSAGSRAGNGPARWVLMGLGVVAGVYGAWLLLSRQDFDQLFNAAIWLVSGVVLHDFVLAPLVLLLVLVVGRVLPVPSRAPAAVAMVVLGTVTIAVIPVLTGLGRRPDNATLLPRSYGVGWLVFAGVVLVCAAIAVLVRSRTAAATPEADADPGAEVGDH